MKEKKETAGFHSEETAYDQGLKRMEERDAWMEQLENSPAVRAAASAAATFAQSHAAIAQAVEPLSAVLEPYHNLTTMNDGIATAAEAIASAAHTAVPDHAADLLADSVGEMAQLSMQSKWNMAFDNAEFFNTISTAAKTPEITDLQMQLENSVSSMEAGLSAVSDYVDNLTLQWDNALAFTELAERGIAAQNFAILRMLPDYSRRSLPRGSKRVLKSLTKTTAEKLTQTEDILFDPKEKNFYHKDTPEQKLTADQMTVVESSMDLFADISFDELVSFESQLCEDVTFAIEHPVGKKIFEIIKGWKSFISFDDATYYHARKLEEGQEYFLDQEMLRAPRNVSSHGRYNAIGKSCYYVAETRDGAVNEIAKHSGGKKVKIQVVGLKAVKKAKIIDLSGEIKGTNKFMEHMRFTVENEEGKIVKEYLLPNFVTSCCKRLGIEGIKYRSTGYDCCVLWKDDYFEFVEGSRRIIVKKGKKKT